MLNYSITIYESENNSSFLEDAIEFIINILKKIETIKAKLVKNFFSNFNCQLVYTNVPFLRYLPFCLSFERNGFIFINRAKYCSLAIIFYRSVVVVVHILMQSEPVTEGAAHVSGSSSLVSAELLNSTALSLDLSFTFTFLGLINHDLAIGISVSNSNGLRVSLNIEGLRAGDKTDGGGD